MIYATCFQMDQENTHRHTWGKEGRGSDKANMKQMQPKCLQLVNPSEGILEFFILFLKSFCKFEIISN